MPKSPHTRPHPKAAALKPRAIHPADPSSSRALAQTLPTVASGLTLAIPTTARWIWENPNWPNYTWDPARLAEPLSRVREAQNRLQMATQILAPATTNEVVLEVLTSEAVSTSAIEGVSMNPSSIASSLAKRLGLPGHPISNRAPSEESLSAILMSAIEDADKPLTAECLADWQGALFVERPLAKLTVGAFRTEEVVVASGHMEKLTIHFEGVPANRLQEEMQTFIGWFNTSRGKLDGMIRAGLAHLWLVTIHPFDDGNGRVTRALTDMAIEQDGHVRKGLLRMSRRILSVKKDYYKALQAMNGPDDIDATPWLSWFLEQAAEGAKDTERIIRQVLAKTVFWAQHKTADLNERQRKVLSRLLDAGPGGFEGGMSTKKYEHMTGCSTATASRDLIDLAKQGCLRITGSSRRATRYEIPWDEFLREA